MDIEILSLSPDGRYRVQATPWEAGNSHWVYLPEIIDTERDHCVFAFKSRLWTADRAVWLDAVRVQMVLRKYPGRLTGTGLRVTVDCARATAMYREGIEIESSALEHALDTMLDGVEN
ncbi:MULTISPECIES: hypothetical protein [Pseudomonas]